MRNFDENWIKVTDYQLVSELPNLFQMEDGTPVTDKVQWEKRREELYRTAVEIQYGTMPPEPEFLEVDPMDDGATVQSFRITTGPKNHPVSFIMRTIRPMQEGVFPAIVDGDLCWAYAFNRDFINAMIDRGIMFVTFNRTELAADVNKMGRHGPLYEAYPEYTFGAVGAWAWGFSRCVDALEKIGFADMNSIAFSGHSRGGKACLLAGALDQRACIVNPNDSGGGGAGCYRVHMRAIQEDGVEQREENLKDLVYERFPFWFGPELRKYIDKESELPFDEHFLKALVAPRILLETNAASDIWANPIGTWQTAMAAKEAYRFLDAEQNLLFYYRKGVHSHHVDDIRLLADIMNQKNMGEPFEKGSFALPFKKQEPAFHWVSPKK